MMYAIYLPDGRIHQCNKHYAGEDELEAYEKLLNENGEKFVKRQMAGFLPAEHFFVDVNAEEIIERPAMPIEISKPIIQAGSNEDAAIFTGIPAGCLLTVMAANEVIQSIQMGNQDTELELFIPIPCIYRVMFDKWPYRQFVANIEAIA